MNWDKPVDLIDKPLNKLIEYQQFTKTYIDILYEEIQYSKKEYERIADIIEKKKQLDATFNNIKKIQNDFK